MSGASLPGFDRYSGSTKTVGITMDGPHVVLTVEATSGSNEGESLLTPAQARSVASWLTTAAELAEQSSTMAGSLE